MDFSLPAGNSRRRRRLKKPGAPTPGFTGVWGRSATNKHASVYTEALLATTFPSICHYFSKYLQLSGWQVDLFILLCYTLHKYGIIVGGNL